MLKTTLPLAAVVAALAAAPAFAQQKAPTPGCSATPAQLEANRKAAMAFFRQGITPAERTALLDPGYIQHNPRFKKYAIDNKLSDYDAFKAMMAQQAGQQQGQEAGGPRPPAQDPYAVVTAECDIVTMVRKVYRQDPTAAPGTWYESYTFDTFRVRNGKLVEHWDAAVLDAPPAPAR